MKKKTNKIKIIGQYCLMNGKWLHLSIDTSECTTPELLSLKHIRSEQDDRAIEYFQKNFEEGTQWVTKTLHTIDLTDSKAGWETIYFHVKNALQAWIDFHQPEHNENMIKDMNVNTAFNKLLNILFANNIDIQETFTIADKSRVPLTCKPVQSNFTGAVNE